MTTWQERPLSLPRFSQSFESLKRDGFIRIRNNTVVPTRKGFLFADRLPLLLS
jgi:hypothetical protein